MEPSELKAFRKSQNLTQEAFAKWLKAATKRAVVAWENGQNPVPGWVAEKIQQSEMLLNPKVSYDVFRKNEEMAKAAGLTMDEWLGRLMEEAEKIIPHPKS